MTVLSVYRTRNGVLASADHASIHVLSSAGTEIVPETTVEPESEGVYVFITPTLNPGRYTAIWVFTQATYPTETIERPFQVDQALEYTSGLSLMDLEQTVARRIGPYRRLRAGGTSSLSSISVPRLQSAIAAQPYEDLYVLRRGLDWEDVLVPNFSQDDRVRQVATYDANLGTLTPDRVYASAPITDEVVELHVLDPDEELRPAVLDGLRRCFFWDTVQVTVLGAPVAASINLTQVVPWLTEVNQVSLVGQSGSSLLPPTRLSWFQAYREGRDVKLRMQSYALGPGGSLTIQALRPVWSYVNGEVSYTGPNDDFDIVAVDRDYAAWAGVIECWKNYPEMLTPLAAQNMRPSREDAATEFTKKSLTIVQQMPEYPMINYGRSDIVQIGNLPEPV